MNEQNEFPGLDYDFLRYMGVRAESQRRIQRHYLPHFAHCRRVIDLGCGDGDFVALLLDHGIDAIGVDADAKALQAARARDLPVVQQDVFAYLAETADASADGIFCAHLVEHLPYAQVIQLIRESWRILQPGGVIVLATPDVRTIFSHLEMFYLHFGHVSFYHPRLLCFFLEYAGFVDAHLDVNPETASPMLPAVPELLEKGHAITPPPAPAADALLTYQREIPQRGAGLLQALSYRVKRLVTRWLVQPLLDDVVTRTHAVLHENHAALAANIAQNATALRTDIHTLAATLHSINGPFECYAQARKPTDER